MNVIITVIIALAFFSLWWLIEKFPNACIKIFPYMKRRYLDEDTLHVFSAETSSGDEAEFIDEGLPEKNRIIRFFRIILSLVVFTVILYLLFFL